MAPFSYFSGISYQPYDPTQEKSFIAQEYDLSKGAFTGREETYRACSLRDAVCSVLYTRGISEEGWVIGASGGTVQRTTGDLAWHVQEQVPVDSFGEGILDEKELIDEALDAELHLDTQG